MPNRNNSGGGNDSKESSRPGKQRNQGKGNAAILEELRSQRKEIGQLRQQLKGAQRQPVGTDGVASDGSWYRLATGLKFHIWLMALTSDAKKADLFPHLTFARRAANFLQVACGILWQSARA